MVEKILLVERPRPTRWFDYAAYFVFGFTSCLLIFAIFKGGI